MCRSLTDESGSPCKTVWSAFCAEVAEYPVDKVAEITWLTAEDIVEAARLYANSKPATIHWGVAIDMTPAITPTAQAIAALWCITGNLDVPGGNVIARHAFDAVAYALPGAKGPSSSPIEEADKKRIGKDRYGPLSKFIWRAQTDVALDQIFTGEPVSDQGHVAAGLQPRRRHRAGPEALGQRRLKKLDFVVGVDLFMTPHRRVGRRCPAGRHLP